VELLERDGALAALARAREAARRGEGAVVLVTGEPGIGKTALVNRFREELEPGARVLVGMCDDLSIPRPLGPLRDLVGGVSRELADAVSAGAHASEVQALLVAELERPPRPTVLVLEDIHWADDATLDTITVLGRRIAALPALLVLTFRTGEAPPGHRLHAVVGGMRAEAVELAPLSEDAVASLAGGRGDEVFATTGGNPFYVGELLAAPADDELPRSVANAVRGRAARLDPAARRLVELVSVVPNRVATAVLDAVAPDWAAAAEEPERRQLLEVDAHHVRFRHELARNAIRSSVPIAARRRLHAEILEALLAAGADPADIVHHAEAAGAEAVVAEYALVAARRAAALDSNREAYSHYRRAAVLAGDRPLAEQAAVHEELAAAAYAADRIEEALAAIEHAIETFREVGELEAIGRCMRIGSRLHWYAGDGDAAFATVHEAIRILEPLGESRELARAYSVLAQLAMLSEDTEPALDWGGRALELATKLGDERTRAHALVNLGSARIDLDRADTAMLLEAHAVADRAGDRHEAARALVNLGYALLSWVEPAASRRYAERGLAYSEEYEVHTLAIYAALTVAWLRLRAGDWDAAEQVVRRELARDSSVTQLVAKSILTELAVRRGDPDAGELLADLAEQAERTGEVQRLAPVLELETERALTGDAPMPLERFRTTLAEIRRRQRSGWGSIRVAAWASVAGIDGEADERMPAPLAAMVRRDWRGAADAFGAVGWTYDRALLLSLLDEEPALVEALEIARGLGAEPLSRRVTGRLRELGLRVPPRPREASRSNAAGLTARQLEVLALLAGGLTNAEIADRLVVSPRTAEHHVAAVLTKLGAATRRDAARRASELGLLAVN
jgi:predicted ATPase/DNA-binding CsgD family transcriptional regulator